VTISSALRVRLFWTGLGEVARSAAPLGFELAKIPEQNPVSFAISWRGGWERGGGRVLGGKRGRRFLAGALAALSVFKRYLSDFFPPGTHHIVSFQLW